MRSIFISIFLVFSTIASAATYYVATTGSDSNPGTINSPFKSWQKGFTVAQPGDIVYVRGGTYYPTGTSGHDAYSGVYIRGKNGSAGRMINIWAYPGEKPILDCKNMTNAATHIGVYLDDCDYWYLKGLTIKNCLQTPGYGAHGLWLRTGDYNRFEQLDISYVGGSGLCVLYEAEKNYIYNCDIHDCFDQYTKNSDGTPNPGEHADGIDLASITERNGNERVNTMRGVRAWNNSDDGFDHYNVEGVLIIDSCWVWHNGYNYGGTTPTGNGNGFKLGVADGTPESYTQRTVTNCIAYDNRQRGYSQEAANVNMILYNNIAYKNKLQGFAFVAYNRPDILRNNISYSNGSIGTFQSRQTHDHNSWDSGVTVSDADFASLDASHLMRPRKANGCLPDISFLTLANGSDMIDKGVNVGRAYTGSAPDMGAFEKSSTTTVTSPPAYVSSVVPPSMPGKIEITFSLPLASVLPSASSFSVMVNSASRSVSSVAISGSKAILTLSSAVSAGNTVTVAYTKPSTNPLQGTTSNQVSSFSSRTVTNSVSASSSSTTMQYVSSVIENATPTRIKVTYNLALASTLCAPSRFAVHVNSVARTVTSISVSGTNVYLNLSSPVSSGSNVAIWYTKPTTNLLVSTTGSEVPNMSAMPVTNLVGSSQSAASTTTVTAPTFLSSAIVNPNLVAITYDQSLSPDLPPSSSFNVEVESAPVVVDAVEISGPNVLLTLDSPVSSGDEVILDYTIPEVNPIQSAQAAQAPNLNDVIVANTLATVIPEYVSSVIESASPDVLLLTYTSELATSTISSDAFIALVNGNSIPVSSVNINGNTVALTLPSKIHANDKVTITYNKPVANPLQTNSGGIASAFSEKQVLNNSNIKAEMTIYPNPATEYINITNLEPVDGGRSLRILDYSGKVCMESTLEPDNSSIPINLKKGIYIVQIVTGEIIQYAQKLVVR